MKEHVDAGRELVMVSHSFGGLPATDSVVGETVRERQEKGLAGGVRAVVYIAAFAPPAPGMSLFKIIGVNESSHPSWWSPKGDLAVLAGDAKDLLYNDIDKAVAQMAMDIMVPQSLVSNISVCAHGTSEIVVPKTYVAARNDLVLPYEGQRAMAQAAGAKMVELECGHSPFLKDKETLLLLDVIEKSAM
ncbi:hypothetical protein QQS21_003392 [Conoideocrella luteorostrata]|uniref:AB hydrolase-1 domain-containing protein n=1 Tax=Conoideocrella luteorostrata TaxID=1105319 RepID=A0AAJ0CTD4_9HYPO|nr:hypothetical protein QQS21_003392 [Conoideocrella luteorostrata]